MHADLELIVRRSAEAGRTVLTFELLAPDPALELSFLRFGEKVLEREPQTYFGELFKDVDELPRTRPRERESAARRLEALTSLLARELLPRELRHRLWQLRGTARTLLVQSEEAWIPWELLRLQPPAADEDAESRAGQFLCEAFALSRWPLGQGRYFFLPCRRMALIIPKSGLRTRSEVTAIRQAVGPERVPREVAAGYPEVLEALGSHDAIHFAGHGQAEVSDPDRWAVLLDNAETLRPDDLSHERVQLRRNRPLIFLNGCTTGRGAQSLTGLGGWGYRAIQAGAGAVLGTFWQISDACAKDFAETFYDGLLTEGLPIAEAVRQARDRLRQSYPGDPTWLAYTLFAQPMASAALPEAVAAAPPAPIPTPRTWEAKGVPAEVRRGPAVPQARRWVLLAASLVLLVGVLLTTRLLPGLPEPETSDASSQQLPPKAADPDGRTSGEEAPAGSSGPVQEPVIDPNEETDKPAEKAVTKPVEEKITPPPPPPPSAGPESFTLTSQQPTRSTRSGKIGITFGEIQGVQLATITISSDSVQVVRKAVAGPGQVIPFESGGSSHKLVVLSIDFFQKKAAVEVR